MTDPALDSSLETPAPGTPGTPESEMPAGAAASGGDAPDDFVPAAPVHAEEGFADLGLRSSVMKGLTEAGFKLPTVIQAALIPRVIAGKDVLGQAKTGTGKTAAFGLPILHMADKDLPQQALILTPTRELAVQVTEEINKLARHTPIRAACVIGGDSMKKQRAAIEAGAHIIVGTPGRVKDMHDRRQLPFNNIRFVVLDEVDRMLDIGFRDEIRQLLGLVKGEKHQTIFVSATISDEIERLARRFMRKDVEKIETAAGSLTVELVDQKYLAVAPWDKKQLLLHLLRHEEPDTTLVFCRMKVTVKKLAEYLSSHGVPAKEIHGDLHQKKRNRVIDSMRKGQLDVLIASDLAARGLDIEHISHVINYDLPEDPEVYIHRIGRTARAGRQGIAWSFVTPEDGQKLTAIEKLAGVLIEKMEYPDFTPGPVPSDIAEQRQRDADRMERLKAETAGLNDPAVLDDLSEEQKKAMFPNGVMPKSTPKRNLASRFKRRR